MPPVVPLSALASLPLLMTGLHRGIVERTLAPLGARIKVEAEIDSVDAIRELVLQGRWATVMPVSVFKEQRAGHARLSEISGVQLHRMLVLATRIERAQSSAIAVVTDLVRAETARLAAEGVFSFGQVAQPAHTLPP
jgi:LysR family nitrogen assimilation transcriptional regulator